MLSKMYFMEQSNGEVKIIFINYLPFSSLLLSSVEKNGAAIPHMELGLMINQVLFK